MTNPTMLNSDDQLSKLGGRILEASIELDACLQCAAGELIGNGEGAREAALRFLARAAKARRELLDQMISWSAEAGYPMNL